MSIEFKPLYWVYHDFWDYQSKTWVADRHGIKTTTKTFNHLGHMHFFMPGFYTGQANAGQAYSGTQTYQFDLQHLWSPQSNDPNQQFNFRIVGKPKWYFLIEQYWRRIYIQDWDYKDNPKGGSFLGKRGVKYDASLPQHTRGIYRQTKANYFFYTDLCRTLPIEYWKNENKTVRDHYLRMNNSKKEYLDFYQKLGSQNWKKNVNQISENKWDFENDYPKLKNPNIIPQYAPTDNLVDYADFYTHYDQFTIPRGSVVDSVANYQASKISEETGKPEESIWYQAFGDQSGARISSIPDRYYIYPTIQYQKVVHKNWQRLDGWQQRDLQDQQTGEQFGDGDRQTIVIPFVRNINGSSHIQSPFSDDNGQVYPVGQYMHNVVPQQQKLKYNLNFDKNNYPQMNNYEMQFVYNKPRSTWHYMMPNQLARYDGNDMLMQWNCPSIYKNYLDGMWVQQCLGAKVQAKVKIITQDNYGGRKVNWVSTTNFQLTNQFVGKDQ